MSSGQQSAISSQLSERPMASYVRIVEPSAELIAITPRAEEAIEAAARTCYKSEAKMTPGSAGPFVRMLIERGHECPLEQADATFRIVCDRGVSHELVRHRLASYCQESTRYCDYSNERFGDEIRVIAPPGLENDVLWQGAISVAARCYRELRAKGIAPQIARSVLPTCLKTEIVVKANLREWRLILRSRTSPAAHPQMREIAQKILDQLKFVCPNVFADIGKATAENAEKR